MRLTFVPWNKAIGLFREFGFGVGSLYIIDQLLRRLSNRSGLFVYEMMAQPISETRLLSERLAKRTTARMIEAGDPALHAMPVPRGVLEARFLQGARCIGVFRSGELIGYVWLSFVSYQEDEVRCTYWLESPGDSVFDFDLYVFPQHRMGTGFAAVWDAANAHLRGLGISHSFSRMTRFNLASRRAHQRLGSRCVARAMFLRLSSAELMLASVRPFVWLSLSRSSRSSLRLEV